jgi:hypothetical protein
LVALVKNKQHLCNKIKKEIRLLTKSFNESLNSITVKVTMNNEVIEAPIHIASKNVRLQLGTKFLDQVELPLIEINHKFDDLYHQCLVLVYHGITNITEQEKMKLRAAGWFKEDKLTNLGLQKLEQLRELGPVDKSDKYIIGNILDNRCTTYCHSDDLNRPTQGYNRWKGPILDWLEYKGFLVYRKAGDDNDGQKILRNGYMNESK